MRNQASCYGANIDCGPTNAARHSSVNLNNKLLGEEVQSALPTQQKIPHSSTHSFRPDSLLRFALARLCTIILGRQPLLYSVILAFAALPCGTVSERKRPAIWNYKPYAQQFFQRQLLRLGLSHPDNHLRTRHQPFHHRRIDPL